ncbi:alkylhydroperoxidase [Tenacibaculum maritimum]|uniref:Alkylhydroperoxidase AhpD family core domain protein n=1 Tax=Tenacibaculum maritimum NCIMB 2154 TaxID=1349785 RepID=A0A2H1E9F2_9FLAO|nr:alkylhydroperoxidase [Tenacibaculum maritimum]SFZ81716.1 Alkylhydroperoxidase AhpD family core domain protein [Tenacibaculum maritimum NCIMB 2154]
MSRIRLTSFNGAVGKLKHLYKKVIAPSNNVDSIIKSHGLRSHTMVRDMLLYKNALYGNSNTLPKWYLETLGIYVSLLNECGCCVARYFSRLKRILKDSDKFYPLKKALESKAFESFFEATYSQGIRYAVKLTNRASKVAERIINPLRKKGLKDGEVLEINQVVSYFNDANRTVLDLGVST